MRPGGHTEAPTVDMLRDDVKSIHTAWVILCMRLVFCSSMRCKRTFANILVQRPAERFLLFVIVVACFNCQQTILNWSAQLSPRELPASCTMDCE